ncbi:Toxin CdiA [Sporomusa rhizae]|uniref:two-partner secretion domain-containing protein n=1 Tax=Sporomusa rhizae TaxID=357999 RepID=UPI00352B4267
MSGFSLKKKAQKLTAWITLVLFSLQPIFVAAQTVADPNAAKQNRPTVESAQNGTPVVQIAAPTAGGVSHNLYQQFNIDPKGLILNNSFGFSKTQLAGYIQGNPNLAGGSARVILNEVTSNNISHLRGYLEVAGQRADVIIANRNGIIGNGFGFINTNRGVLTTGTPVFGGNGSLEAFRVTGGQIAVQGDGINATGADRVDLISRAVTVNAGIWAKELNVVTGPNAVDYNTLTTQTVAGDSVEPQPQVAIDVSALGGMYANKIKLVGTEQGVGVNSQGTLSADSGNLILTNNGQITLAGKTSASGSINISATDDINAQGTIFAKQNTNINSNGTLTNTGTIAAGNNTDLTAKTVASAGTIAAGIKTDGTVGTAGNLTVNATGTITSTGKNIAGSNLNLTGTTIDVSGATTYAGNSANITATNGDIDHNGATTQVNGQLTLNATGAVKNLNNTNNQTGQITAGQIAITAKDIQNQDGTIQQTGSGDTTLTATGTIDNTGGTIATNGTNLTVKSNTINNSQGKLQHAGTGTLGIQTTDGIQNTTGTIATNGQATLNAQNLHNTQGTINAGKDLKISLNGNLANNQNGQLKANQNLTMNIGGTVTNAGTITAVKDADINAKDMTNETGGTIITGNNLSLVTSGTLTNQGTIYAQGNTKLESAGALTNTGLLAAAKDTTLSANTISSSGVIGSGLASDGSIGNTGTLTIKANTTVATTGQTLAGGDLAITGTAIDHTGGKTSAGGTVSLTATSGDINNTGGEIQTHGALTIAAAGNINNDKDSQGKSAQITAGKVTAVANSISNKGGIIKQSGTESTNITATTAIDNTDGTIASNAEFLTVETGILTNTNGKIQHAGAGELTIQAANTMTNTSGSIATNGQQTIQTQALNNTKGTIVAKKQLIVKAPSLVNSQGTLAGDSIHITSQTITNNQQGLIQAQKGLTVKAQNLDNQTGSLLSLDNSGAIIAVGQTIQNSNGVIGGNGDVTITAANLTSQQGQILAQGDLAVTTSQGLDNTKGKMVSQKNINLNQNNTIVNNTSGTITAGGDLNVQANTMNSTGGTLIATNDVNLTAQNLINGTTTAGRDVNLTVTGDYTQETGQVQANRDVNIQVTGIATNKGSINAVETVKLNATTVNSNTGAVISANKQLKMSATNDVNNGGKLDSDLVDVKAQNINNTGTIMAKNLTMNANTIKNTGDAAMLATTTEMNLNAKTTLENKDGATIYSIGNITIAGSDKRDEQGQPIDRSGSVLNQSAKIEADGNIAIYAKDITNKRRVFVTGQRVVSTDYPKAILVRSDRTDEGEDIDIYLVRQTVTEVGVLETSSEGKIAANGNMFLRANVINNDNSRIMARNTLDATGVINNVSQTQMRVTTQRLVSQSDLSLPCWWNETIYEELPSTTAIFGGGQSVTIQAPTITNITKNPASINGVTFSAFKSIQQSNVSEIQTVLGNTNTTPIGQPGTTGSISNIVNKNSMNITLPSNGLYNIHTEPGSRYLVETDPRFANYQTFISSDYMLQNLGLDPAKTMKLVGDAFYQQKLIRDQVGQLTGKQFLGNYSSNNEEYKELMDNGTTFAKQFNLQVGISLTPEQMSQLTSDIVWMVEQEVQGMKVLVPVVYLAPRHTSSLNSKGSIIAAKDVQITADQEILNQNSKIIGENISLIAGRDIKSETTTYVAETENHLYNIRTIAGQTAEISATGNLNLNAGQDVQLIGGKLLAGKNLTIDAGRNLEIGAITTKDKTTARNETTTNLTSGIKAGGNISMISQQNINLNGAQMEASNDFILKSSSGNINIGVVKNEEIHDIEVGTPKNWKRIYNDDETVIGSNLQAGGSVTITAKPDNSTNNANGGNVTISGSTIYSENGKIAINADKDVTIQEVKEKHESQLQTHRKKRGTLSSKTTDTLDYSLTNQVKGSNISGDKVDINSGNNLTVKAGTIVATNDVTLQAGNDVTLTSAQETGNEEHYKRVKKSGLLSGGGLGFSIGKESTTTTLNEQVKAEIGSTVGSVSGNVTVTAGNKVKSEGTTFVSGKDTNITGKEVTIDNTINTYDSQYKFEYKKSGLTVSLGGAAVDAGLSLANDSERMGQVKDERLQALYGYKAAKDLKTLGRELKGNPKDGLSVNISLGSTKMTTEQNTHVKTINPTNITAGANVTIKAIDGDVNLKATNINAANITIDAVKDLNIESAQNKMESSTKTSSSSASIGASFGLGTGAFNGFTGSFNSSKGKENESSTTNTESVVNASGTATLKSGNDTNIIGSQVKGNKVEVNVGDNLNLVSQQDSDTYTAKNQSAGIGFGTGNISGTHGSIGAGKTKSNYDSVTEQAGIFAGKDGFAIKVGKNTDLKGAVIASDATPDKNKISTDTLTYSDIQNHAEYSSSSVGVGYNAGKDANGKDVAKKDQGLMPNLGVTAQGDADSTTKSAISPGTIEVRSNPNQDLSNLSRDTAGAVNALGKIFDKAKVQEQQELARVFGEEAFKAIGDLNLKEGSPEKAALDAFAGGLMAKLGGGNFASGAAGAGFNQLLMNELKNIKDPAVMQWASAIVGAAAAKLVGGNAQTGASVAASETKNNFLSHEQYAKYQKQLKELKEKLEDGSISPEEYNEAVNKVVTNWAAKDKEQTKQWLAEHHIDAVLIEDESGRIALEKQQYQQMVIELSNSKSDEETAAIKAKWHKVSDEQIDKWNEMGDNLGVNMDGTNYSSFPKLSTEVVNLKDKYSYGQGIDFALGFGKGLKYKVDEIPEFMLKSDPKQIDDLIESIPGQLQSAWNDGLENTTVKVAGKVYKITIEDWKKQYNAIQTISNPEERGKKTAELLVDIGTTFAAVRSVGKAAKSFNEFGIIDEAKAALNNENGSVRIGGAGKAFNNGGVLDNANFAQKKFNAAGKFSDGGIEYWEKTLGRRVETMEELKSLIKSGEVKVSQVPIDYIVRDGNTLILNTRSSQVLTELGIPRSQWNAVNRTGQDLYETNLTNQLARNKLTSEGVPNVVQSGK